MAKNENRKKNWKLKKKKKYRVKMDVYIKAFNRKEVKI